ncbi:glycosyltransferase [Yersinia mollaretii]|uniref:glycosyltransferase n=1 Tax=Yersinia mollaretii TaxID=33060 RepID=UPI0025AA42ED|nr:glycosyltransferase [Yersinia mollaretii]MDN0109158.1 glycosyltransferase [Yersinia mollaretii]
METVVVNATALDASGALTILNQFIENIPEHNVTYIIFISDKFNTPKLYSNNITFIPVTIKSWYSRIYWDFYGLNQWLKKNLITPKLIISLQNTSIYSSKGINQVIYLHQPIPFHKKKWKFYKRDEYKLFLYKKFYSRFIFLFINDETLFFVQTNWMKVELQKKGISKNKIRVLAPDFKSIDISSVKNVIIPKAEKVIFYPAMPLAYKNHIEIVNALYFLKSRGVYINNILCVFTINKGDNLFLLEKIEEYGLIDNFYFIGKITYKEVLSLYKQCTVVMFPSYIESFGLPLREAALFGKPIIASDENYAREVLLNYSGVTFVKAGCPEQWANALVDEINKNIKYPCMINISSSSWELFFNYIESEAMK